MREIKRKTKGAHQEDQRNAKGNSKRNRRKIKGKAIGTPKENRRISRKPKKSEKEHNDKTK